MKQVDLNSDLGEGFGPYKIGDDDALLSVVTSANIACGFHAGDPEIMARSFRVAKERGVAVGAHPGFPDLAGFGRRRIPFTLAEVEHLFAYQIGAAQAVAACSGHAITYVKPHGALANMAETERDVADALARAVRTVDRSLAFLAIALSEQVRAAEAAGLKAISEIFADRGYSERGQLLPRGKAGAFIESPEQAAERALRMIEAGAIITAGSKNIPTEIGSVCVHSDGPNAPETARQVRARLEGAGIRVAAFSGP